jgi:hypothetical protein
MLPELAPQTISQVAEGVKVPDQTKPAEHVRKIPDTAVATFAVMGIGGLIAAVAPFDLAFAAATFGSPVLRVALFFVIVLAGSCFARRAGFSIAPSRTGHPVLIGLGAAIVVAAVVSLIDGVLFRTNLEPAYVHIFTAIRLRDRYTYFMLRAFNENVFYRMFLFSMLTCLFGAMWRDPSRVPPTAAVWIAMIVSQASNIMINLVLPSHEALSPAVITYDAVRYMAPGVLWAYLYRWYGFVTAEIASVGCHVFLQPVLGGLL